MFSGAFLVPLDELKPESLGRFHTTLGQLVRNVQGGIQGGANERLLNQVLHYRQFSFALGRTSKIFLLNPLPSGEFRQQRQ